MISQNNSSTTAPVSQTPLRVVVLVSGTGSLMEAIVGHQDDSYEVIKVIADVDCPAIGKAQSANIPTEVVSLGSDRGEWNTRLAEAVGQPDLIVSAGFMRILGEGFLGRFEGRTINTHPALLPSFKGAHGVRDALEFGVKITGSTVHFVDAGVDTGKIIAQQPVAVRAEDDEESLHERIKIVERELIVTVLRAAHVDDNGQLDIPL